jgi:hypothetical protein
MLSFTSDFLKNNQEFQKAKSLILKNSFTKILTGIVILACITTVFKTFHTMSSPIWIISTLLMICMGILIIYPKASKEVIIPIKNQAKKFVEMINEGILKTRMWNHELIKKHPLWYTIIVAVLITISALVIYRVFIYEPPPFYKKFLPW